MVKTIIKFSATWCAPCKTFAHTFHEVKKMEEFSNIEFKEFDVEEDGIEDLVEKFKISTVPCTILLDENGELLKKVSGNIPRTDFVTIIKSELK